MSAIAAAEEENLEKISTQDQCIDQQIVSDKSNKGPYVSLLESYCDGANGARSSAEAATGQVS